MTAYQFYVLYGVPIVVLLFALGIVWMTRSPAPHNKAEDEPGDGAD